MSCPCPNPRCKGNGFTDQEGKSCETCQTYWDGFTGIDFYKAMKKDVSDK